MQYRTTTQKGHDALKTKQTNVPILWLGLLTEGCKVITVIEYTCCNYTSIERCRCGTQIEINSLVHYNRIVGLIAPVIKVHTPILHYDRRTITIVYWMIAHHFTQIRCHLGGGQWNTPIYIIHSHRVHKDVLNIQTSVFSNYIPSLCICKVVALSLHAVTHTCM